MSQTVSPAAEPTIEERRAAKAARTATVASAGGSYLTARASGMSKKDALALHPLRKPFKPGRIETEVALSPEVQEVRQDATPTEDPAPSLPKNPGKNHPRHR